MVRGRLIGLISLIVEYHVHVGHVSNRILHESACARVAAVQKLISLIIQVPGTGKLKSDIGVVRNGFSREIMMEFDTQCRSRYAWVSGNGMIRFVREPIGFSKGALTG